MCEFKRLPGHDGEPLSSRITTDGTWFEPPTPENIDRFIGKEVYIATKDGRIFGGRAFDLRVLPGPILRISRTLYLGGGWANIPLDEVIGIKSAW
jgi:hypothetical protein